VNWQAGQIATRGQGRQDRDHPYHAHGARHPGALKGHRPEYVFTYVAQRRHKPRTGKRLVKGQRFPITYSGAKSAWKAMRKRSGITGFRFHDVRHDAGTKLLRATGNLKLVQRALNHADLKTTTRYAQVLDEELGQALDLLARSRDKTATPNRVSSPVRSGHQAT
jgi:integrase